MNQKPTLMLFRRSAALFYDVLLLIAVLIVIMALTIPLAGQSLLEHPLRFAVFALIGFVFFRGFWMHGGQTLGMRAWKLQLVTNDGQRLTNMQCLYRYLTGVLLFGLCFAWALIDRDGIALQDRLSRTIMLRTDLDRPESGV